MNIILKIFLKIIFFFYYVILSFKDKIIIGDFKKVLVTKEFSGGKIMLLALNEKSSLRQNIIELLKITKEEGIFVIAVNASVLREENYPYMLVDVYIERSNYGRDFGSYKIGIQYFFEKKLDDFCERLLIINDSVFYSKYGLREFIRELFNTKIEVLGATENSQYYHHLGSFCISIFGGIVKKKEFELFWKKYKLSNIRPFIIQRGEFALSKILKSLVSSESNFRSMYDVCFLEKKLSIDDDFYRNYYYYRREGDVCFKNRRISDFFEKDEILRSYFRLFKRLKNKSSSVFDLLRLNKKEDENLFFLKSKLELECDYLGVIEFLKYSSFNNQDLDLNLKHYLISLYMNEFTLGSQIHINALALHHCGLPIIKLDLIFRCVLNMNDLIKLRNQLDPTQQEEFMILMLKRLCGNKFLVGLKRIAYQFGIL